MPQWRSHESLAWSGGVCHEDCYLTGGLENEDASVEWGERFQEREQHQWSPGLGEELWSAMELEGGRPDCRIMNGGVSGSRSSRVCVSMGRASVFVTLAFWSCWKNQMSSVIFRQMLSSFRQILLFGKQCIRYQGHSSEQDRPTSLPLWSWHCRRRKHTINKENK